MTRMKFIAKERAGFTEIIQLLPKYETIAIFYDKVGMGYDYVDFLNDKYVDKEVNAEWGEIDRLKRIQHHEKQIKLLKGNKRLCFNEHGNEVKE